MKQTAIEWLLKEWPILKSELPHWLIEQAKEMEKEQILDAYWNGSDSIRTKNEILNEAEEFYNETYGGNK
jgi:3-methyladenine DNA glycosylase AlkD